MFWKGSDCGLPCEVTSIHFLLSKVVLLRHSFQDVLSLSGFARDPNRFPPRQSIAAERHLKRTVLAMMTLPSSIVAAEPTAAFSIEHSQGFPVRGSNHPKITRCGARRLRGRSWRCIALATKLAVCSSVCRLSRGSPIHSRMMALRICCLFILVISSLNVRAAGDCRPPRKKPSILVVTKSDLRTRLYQGIVSSMGRGLRRYKQKYATCALQFSVSTRGV